jgi:stage III sporulation protein SpoIIIAA
MGKHAADRNYEFRNIPGVRSNIKVNRDGEVQIDGHPEYHNVSIITADDGTKMTLQMCIYKAFPDIPMRSIPKW